MNPMLPMNEAVLSAALGLFSKVSLIVSGLVGFVFVMRVCFLSLRIAGSYEYLELVGDTVKYFGITNLFPILAKLVINVTGSLALAISFVPMTQAQGEIEEFMQKLLSDFAMFQIFGRIGDIIMNLVTQSLYTVSIALLLAIAPILIFMSSMLGLLQGISAYFTSLISLCLWPVLWNLLGLLGRELWPLVGSSPISSVTFWLVIQLLQFFSPLFCALLFRSLAPSQAISKVVSVVS